MYQSHTPRRRKTTPHVSHVITSPSPTRPVPLSPFPFYNSLLLTLSSSLSLCRSLPPFIPHCLPSAGCLCLSHTRTHTIKPRRRSLQPPPLPLHPLPLTAFFTSVCCLPPAAFPNTQSNQSIQQNLSCCCTASTSRARYLRRHVPAPTKNLLFSQRSI